MHELTGIITATLTPFDRTTGEIDIDWIGAHLRFLEARGVSGVLTLGTTGEGPSLSMTERQQVLTATLAQRGSLAVIAGTGCAALPDTIDLSRFALEAGADAVLIMPPFYFKGLSEAGVLRYYEAVFAALPPDARVLLYNIPQVTAVPVTHQVIATLLERYPAQCYGIKDSSGDAAFLEELVATYPDLRVFCGNELLFARGLALEVAGLMSAITNTFPESVAALVRAQRQGGDLTAVEQHLLALVQLITSTTPPALKAALPWTSGLPRVSVRAPLVDLTDEEETRLAAALLELEVALPHLPHLRQ